VTEEDDEAGQSWASILAARSVEGREVVAQLEQAEARFVRLQTSLTTKMSDKVATQAEYDDFEQALTEVHRMREIVYRMARQ
jgi:hypothetical protein